MIGQNFAGYPGWLGHRTSKIVVTRLNGYGVDFGSVDTNVEVAMSERFRVLILLESIDGKVQKAQVVHYRSRDPRSTCFSSTPGGKPKSNGH